MLNKGHLLDLLSDKGKLSFHKKLVKQKSPASPSHVKVINVIYGGSDIYALIYSAVKKASYRGFPLVKCS